MVGARARRAVKAWRECQEPKITQDQLGKAVGVSGSYVRHYELGSKDLPLSVRIALARHCEVPFEWFISPGERQEAREVVGMLDPSESPAGEPAV